jgi:hypothetical protein
MRIANQVKGIKLIAGMACLGSTWMLLATPGVGQMSGVSHPDQAPITVDSEDAAPAPAPTRAKPSAAIPAPASETVYGSYVPYRAPGSTDQSSAQGSAAFDPDANIVTEATAGRDGRRPLTSKDDPDAGIVTFVPSQPGEIPEGTLVRVKLREDLSTLTTQPGTRFTAEVTDPVTHQGKVIVPVGSVLEGRVTWVRGGKRISGSAAIHLEPRTVILPDGTQYVLRARVIDTNSWENTKVDSEGTIMRGENNKRNLGVMGLTAGSGAAAGAMIGGVPGALVGAGVGAGVSTVIWLKQDRQAELPKDLGLVFSLTEPMSITPGAALLKPTAITSPGAE